MKSREPWVATACAAPFSSLYLDVRGNVRACCANSTYPLGNITTQSLLEVWNGPETAALRRALLSDDYGRGCDICRPHGDLELHPTAPSRSFDDLAAAAVPEWPVQLELAMSNTCNLQCVMCVGELSSSIRAHREGLAPLPSVYDDAFFAEFEYFLPHLERLKFIGGEPFLSREAWRLWSRLDEIDRFPRCHVTTNGTIRNRRVDWLLERFPVSFTVSLDGATAATFERIRQGARFAEVVANLDHFAEVARAHGEELSLAFCLTTDSWPELPDILRFGEERGLPVGVNLVSEPARFSLWRAEADLLNRVADAWGAECDSVAAQLDLNRGEWLDNVSWVRSTAAEASARSMGTPVHLNGRGAVDAARSIALAHAGEGPILEGEVDAEDRITAVRGTQEFKAISPGIDDYSLVGRPFSTLLSGPIIDRFGTVFTFHSDDRRGQSVQVQEMTFPGDPPTSVQLASAPARHGAPGRVFLSVRGEPPTASA